MKYEIENYGYLDLIVIEMRYMLLTLFLPIHLIVNDYFGRGIDLITLKNLSIYFAVIVIGVPFHTYKKYKLKSKNYLSIYNNELTIELCQHIENISISDISKCIIYNIFGNLNFVIYHSEKSSSFLLNGLNDKFVSEISKHLNGVKVEKANIFHSFKYLINQFKEHNKNIADPKSIATKNNVRTRILLTIIFLGIGAVIIFVTNYFNSYYEKFGTKIPSWIRYTTLYSLFIGLVLTLAKLNEAFSNKSSNKRNNNTRKG